jgi:hypothetical protein
VCGKTEENEIEKEKEKKKKRKRKKEEPRTEILPEELKRLE